jgi:hypothetical protein
LCAYLTLCTGSERRGSAAHLTQRERSDVLRHDPGATFGGGGVAGMNHRAKAVDPGSDEVQPSSLAVRA